MSHYKLLKHAAVQLEATATELEAAQKKVAAAQAAAAAASAAKPAAPSQEKVAADESKKAQRTQLAKLAADKLLQSGLLSSPEKRDQFVTEILDHDQALTKIAKLAEHVQAPTLGKAVRNPDGPADESADSVWNKHASAALSRLNIR